MALSLKMDRVWQNACNQRLVKLHILTIGSEILEVIEDNRIKSNSGQIRLFRSGEANAADSVGVGLWGSLGSRTEGRLVKVERISERRWTMFLVPLNFS